MSHLPLRRLRSSIGKPTGRDPQLPSPLSNSVANRSPPQPLSADSASGLTRGALVESTSKKERLVQRSPSSHFTACHRQPKASAPKMSATLSNSSFALTSSMEPQSSPPAKSIYAPLEQYGAPPHSGSLGPSEPPHHIATGRGGPPPRPPPLQTRPPPLCPPNSMCPADHQSSGSRSSTQLSNRHPMARPIHWPPCSSIPID